MANFLKSLFFGETDESEETKLNRNFDVLKYDGIKAFRAQFRGVRDRAFFLYRLATLMHPFGVS